MYALVENLDSAIDARRIHLRMSWDDVAARSRLSRSVIDKVRQRKPVRPLTIRKLNDALRWPTDAVERIDKGEDLTDWPIEDAADPAPGLVEEALAGDPMLSAESRRIVMDVYRGLRGD